MTNSITQSHNYNSDYTGCKIVNIHRGKDGRNHIVYATLIDSHGDVMLNATLAYIVAELQEKMPPT